MAVEEREEPRPMGTAPLSIEISGAEYLSPTFAPKTFKELNYYTHSQLPPLGRFRKGHELFIIGNVMLRSWLQRIYAGKLTEKDLAELKEKELQMERVLTVVGQTSRGMEGYTASLLTKQTIEYRAQTQQQKQGFLARLGL